MAWAYRLLLGIDLLAAGLLALLALAGTLANLQDSGTSAVLGLAAWVLLGAVFVKALQGGLRLRRAGRTGRAIALLALPALVAWPFLVLVGWLGWAFFHGAVP